MRIYQRAEFDAAHRLPGYPGNCSNIHGHTWRVEVWIEDDPDPESGMVVDYRAIKSYFKAEFDHRLILWKADPLVERLDGLTALKLMNGPPTAENLALRILDDLQAEKVRVHESKDNSAEAIAE